MDNAVDDDSAELRASHDLNVRLEAVIHVLGEEMASAKVSDTYIPKYIPKMKTSWLPDVLVCLVYIALVVAVYVECMQNSGGAEIGAIAVVGLTIPIAWAVRNLTWRYKQNGLATSRRDGKWDM